MVDVGDDGYIANCLHIAENGRKSTAFFGSKGCRIVKTCFWMEITLQANAFQTSFKLGIAQNIGVY
jgi:hypothetical protein